MFLLVTTLIKIILLLLLFTLPLGAVLTWMERRQSAYAQDRLGPQRADLNLFGWRVRGFGLVHIIADGLKSFFKEPFAPAAADRTIFQIAPLIGFATSLVIMAFVPFGPDLQTADIPGIQALLSEETIGANPVIPLQIARVDAGLLYIFAVASLGIYGAALGGWASNSRFALLGALRASAQSISYEIALGLTTVGVLLAFGSTELSQIVAGQGRHLFGGIPAWGVVVQPLAAVLFLTAAIAESKRAPFDMPEGESEIVGYFLEYSSMGFGLFMLGEFIEVAVLAAVFCTLFLGGWQLPWVLGEHSLYLGFASFELSSFGVAVAGAVIWAVKVFLLAALQLQIRWTLPRFRYDQLMRLGWKSLLPLALANIFVTSVLIYLDPSLGVLAGCGIAMVLVFAAVVLAGPRKQAPAHAEAHAHAAHAAADTHAAHPVPAALPAHAPAPAVSSPAVPVAAQGQAVAH